MKMKITFFKGFHNEVYLVHWAAKTPIMLQHLTGDGI